MNIEVKLNFSFGYQWYQSENIYVKGYLFNQDDILYQEKSLIDYFYGIQTEDEFFDKLSKANGIFSVIIIYEDVAFFAVDRTRTFPLFYSCYKDKIIISDDVAYIKKRVNLSINDESVSEFISTGFVTGKYTLVDKIYQVQAGQYLVYLNNNLISKFYHTYLVLQDELFIETKESLENRLIGIFDRVVDRIIKFVDGRQIVVPLSGGFDSRLIVSLLKQKKYENVVCFTYGAKDSFEVRTSKEVANKLGYHWYFIEYDQNTIKDNYILSDSFKEYYQFASNYVSVFLLQDYFAVQYLKEKKIIDEKAVILPGHSGDFLGGSHLRSGKRISIHNIIDSIIEKHYILQDIGELSKKRVIQYVKNIEKNSLGYSAVENFNMMERQAKFIVNANRIYEFFGYQHMIPLWDLELINFFRVLPLKYKVETCMYNEVIFDNFFCSLGIDFGKPMTVNNQNVRLKQYIKSIIKLFLPNVLKRMYIRSTYVDFNKLSLMADVMLKEISERIHCSNLNLIIAKWYILQIRKSKQ